MPVVLEGIEFESIWKVAHKWANKDFVNSDPNNLDPYVKVRLQKITRAVMLKKLSLRNSSNVGVMDIWWWIDIFWDWKVFWALRDSYWKNRFNKTILETHYISRTELIKWCEQEYLSFPEFWQDDNPLSKVPESLKETPLRAAEKDKIACQAIAMAFWKIDPEIHPSHMAKSYALQHYGNAKLYKDPNTVKSWITPLAPPDSKKNGRPLKKPYLIDLKTGGLRQLSSSISTKV